MEIPRGDYTPDADLLTLVGRWRRVGWLVIIMIVLLFAGALMTGYLSIASNRSLISHQQDKLSAAQRRIEASCSWWRDVGSGDFLGRMPDPAERALVVIIADSRAAFIGQGCAGHLPPISPTLRRWADYFNLAITP